METKELETMRETHEVSNQPPPLEHYNLYLTDRALIEAAQREGGAWAEDRLSTYGEILGRPETIRLGFLANRNSPELRTHDRFGHRIDEVEFHPAWHEIMSLAMAHELHNLPWRTPRSGANVARSTLNYMHAQIESGSGCPITMTYACLPTLRHQEEVAAEWEPRVLGTDYDGRMVPATEKRAVLIGMAMTEKQGGSDVRANTTRAVAIDGGGPGGAYELTGHKWFCSAPMCDAFLTLAQTDKGLSCFLVPRWRPDGTRNAFYIERLKDKVGNRSNASSEIEYRGTYARMIGEEGRGVRTIIEMVHHTRLDCVSGSAGLMRQAVAQAIHHASHRSAFGRRLLDQPLMQNVLADLALESQAATALMLRLARSYDEGVASDDARAFARIATAVAKFWVCKRAPHLTYEAMECLGGNGYVEETIMPRLYREAPVNAIWEGSGNVICLDVLRAIAREPDSLPALLAELRTARGADARYDAALARLEAEMRDPADAERRARILTERMAVLLEASLLVRHGPAAAADAFCASRLAEGGALVFGTLPAGVRAQEIIEAAAPVPA
jgi:putative acyl-CoA dehydrogenase